jgi:hypothetical protein
MLSTLPNLVLPRSTRVRPTRAYWPVLHESQGGESMTSHSKFLSVLALVAVSIALLVPTHASAALAGIPITGTFTDATGGAGSFVGTFNPQNFGVRNGVLVLIGTLVGTLTDHTGALLGTVADATSPFRSPLQSTRVPS